MATDQNLIAPQLAPDILARQLKLQQQQEYAQRMAQEGAQTLQGQMVGNHFVAPSWTQYLAQGLKSYMGGNASNQAREEEASIQSDQQNRWRNAFGLGGGQPDTSGAQALPVDQGQPSPQALASALGGQPQQSQVPLLPGRSPEESYQAFQYLGPQEYMKQVASQGAPTGVQQNLMGAGLTPGTPEYQAALLEHVNPGQRPTSTMQNLLAAGFEPGTPEYRQAMLDATRSGTTVNVGAGEKAWDTESAKLFAKRYDDISAGAMNAQQMMGMYDLAEQALASGVRTGVGAEAELSLRQLGAALGMDTDPEKLAGGELIRAVQNRMALTMRSPDGGMGMPGALSDRDIKFLKDSQIGIDRSPEGNKAMLSAFRAMENRKIEIARLADEYIEKNGRLDAGFNRTVREYANANPVFQATEPSERTQQLDSILGF